ncbi:CACTA en-spm transposon protein [Cucumis melo var. makuwa]|uniref:CACTA en-spm transposon protein n=1 Tax=Cucumis melo var. makuwa TaxID=1194695 RepID=A0A5D3BE18_CUCMM|nr:CACTA en-spm transposon protein [Cucumis melo var. makuwa]TYJ97239.1 CACTA en-spm transposon protein [Cucumis melo var. makuwa]
MLTTFKEFRADCYRHFKKYSDPEEARANPPNILHELAEKKGELVDRMELFWEIHVRVGTFMSQAAKNAHNQMLELQSQPTPEIELQSKLNEALERIEVQDRNHVALASQVEQMQKLIKDLTRAQQGPPMIPNFADLRCRMARTSLVRRLDKNDVGKGLPNVGGFIAKNGVERGISLAVDGIDKHDVKRGILDVVLVTRGECLS